MRARKRGPAPPAPPAPGALAGAPPFERYEGHRGGWGLISALSADDEQVQEAPLAC